MGEHYENELSFLNALKNNKLKRVYFFTQDTLENAKFEDKFLKLYQEYLQERAIPTPSLQDVYNQQVEEFKLRKKQVSPKEKENLPKRELD